MSFLRSRSIVSDNYLPVTVLYLPVIIYSGLFLTGNGQELHMVALADWVEISQNLSKWTYFPALWVLRPTSSVPLA